jgi:hypothetical protein
MNKLVHDALTDIYTIVEMTPEELEQLEQDKVNTKTPDEPTDETPGAS